MSDSRTTEQDSSEMPDLRKAVHQQVHNESGVQKASMQAKDECSGGVHDSSEDRCGEPKKAFPGLCLSRRPGEAVEIDDGALVVHVDRIVGNKVKLRFEGKLKVVRRELTNKKSHS